MKPTDMVEYRRADGSRARATVTAVEASGAVVLRHPRTGVLMRVPPSQRHELTLVPPGTAPLPEDTR